MLPEGLSGGFLGFRRRARIVCREGADLGEMERRRRTVNAGALLWMALHVCAGVYVVLCGLYRSCSGGTWALLGL